MEDRDGFEICSPVIPFVVVATLFYRVCLNLNFTRVLDIISGGPGHQLNNDLDINRSLIGMRLLVPLFGCANPSQTGNFLYPWFVWGNIVRDPDGGGGGWGRGSSPTPEK